MGSRGACGPLSLLSHERHLGPRITYGIFLVSVSSAHAQKPYAKEAPLSSSKVHTVTTPSGILARTQGLPVQGREWGRAEAGVPPDWPLVLACPALEQLDFKGRGGQQAACELHFVGRAQGKLESCREAGKQEEGGALGTRIQWVGQKMKEGGARGRSKRRELREPGICLRSKLGACRQCVISALGVWPLIRRTEPTPTHRAA